MVSYLGDKIMWKADYNYYIIPENNVKNPDICYGSYKHFVF